MSYAMARTVRRPTRLGDIQSTTQTAQTAVNTARAAQSIESQIVNIFDPGKARDAQRLSRCNFFRDAACIGSVIAAQYVLGGLQNTAGNEIPYYQAARAQIQQQRPDVLAEAVAGGAKWAAGIPDPGGTQSMVNAVQRDLQALQTTIATTPSTPSTPGTPTTSTPVFNPSSPSGGGLVTPPLTFPGVTTKPVGLPPMRTTAPYNYVPWFIGGGILVAGVALTRKRS